MERDELCDWDGTTTRCVNVFMYVLDEEIFPKVLNWCEGVLHTDGGRQSWVLCYPWCGTPACTIDLV